MREYKMSSYCNWEIKRVKLDSNSQKDRVFLGGDWIWVFSAEPTNVFISFTETRQ